MIKFQKATLIDIKEPLKPKNALKSCFFSVFFIFYYLESFFIVSLTKRLFKELNYSNS